MSDIYLSNGPPKKQTKTIAAAVASVISMVLLGLSS